jgi:MFS family permease
MALFRSLANHRFALLWSGQTISRIGDFLYEIALAWWVLQKTGSAVAMAGVLIFSFTPMLLFLLIGGVAVDRYPRVKLMLASDLLRGAVVTLVAVLAFGQQLEIWQVYIASLIFGLVDAFFQPAYTALVPEITSSEDLPSANSLTSMSMQMGRIVGPALGATIIALVGTSGAFVVDGISFFVSAACLAPLLASSAPPSRPADSQASSVLRDMREGIETVLRSPVLWISIIVFALSNITLAGPYSVALPFLVKDHLRADVGTLGLLYAIFPIGYIIGGAWLGRLARIRRRGLTAYAGLMIGGLMLLTFGLPVPLVALVLAALINGAALEIESLIWTNILQETVPGERLGRVSSIDSLGSFVLLPVGFAITGWATDQLGAAPVFLIGGGLTAILAIVAMAHPAIRALD